MPASSPLASVVIASYNRAGYLPATLDSVLAQTHPNVEVIVVDDGSTDDTATVVEPYLDRVTYIHQANAERAAARNNGFTHSSGEYIAFFDSDDLMLPDHIAGLVTALDANRDHGFAYSRCELFDDATNRTFDITPHRPSSGDALLPMVRFNTVAQSSVVLRRSLFEDAGRYDDDRALSGAEDWDLWVRCLVRSPLLFVDQTSIRIRFHPNNTVGDPVMMEAALRLARQRFTAIPEVAAAMRGHETELLAHFHVTLAQHWMLAGDAASARRVMLEAVRADPSILRVPVVTGMFARAALGTRMMDGLRAVRRAGRVRRHREE